MPFIPNSHERCVLTTKICRLRQLLNVSYKTREIHHSRHAPTAALKEWLLVLRSTGPRPRHKELTQLLRKRPEEISSTMIEKQFQDTEL